MPFSCAGASMAMLWRSVLRGEGCRGGGGGCVGGAAVVVGAASRSTVAISGWLVLLSGMATGEGGGLPSPSLVLRCGFGGGASSSPIVNANSGRDAADSARARVAFELASVLHAASSVAAPSS